MMISLQHVIKTSNLQQILNQKMELFLLQYFSILRATSDNAPTTSELFQVQFIFFIQYLIEIN